VLFQGAPRDLIGQARGHVWAVTAASGQPPAGVSVVSSVQLENGTHYRVLGQPADGQGRAVDPTLEDGYMWLMSRVKDGEAMV
jgi:hypothetical protein